ncbi:MAG: hypothetical protein EBT13_10670, partial [Rhodobacteraceae bacterium]|nr:hypothetical protein [Paracoccaceae bacterium]
SEGFIGKRELKDGNTHFEPSLFSEAIQEEQIVLLDEVSRSPDGANNILFPLLDHRKTLINPQGEDVQCEAFIIATANEGVSFTGTRTMDEAFRNRFYVINIDYAPQEVEIDILTKRDGITKADATRITGIAKTIREQAVSGDLTRSVSLRELFIASEQIAFGFSLEDIRQWLLVYENEGTQSQMRKWVELADRQLIELEEQQRQLEQTMQELRALRDETANSLA